MVLQQVQYKMPIMIFLLDFSLCLGFYKQLTSEQWTRTKERQFFVFFFFFLKKINENKQIDLKSGIDKAEWICTTNKSINRNGTERNETKTR